MNRAPYTTDPIQMKRKYQLGTHIKQGLITQPVV